MTRESVAAAESEALEAAIKRNPHREDFKTVEGRRPDWDTSENGRWKYTKTRNPGWKFGDGARAATAQNGCLEAEEKGPKDHMVEIDPYSPGRPAVLNYKLLISGFVPRPIGLLSTRSQDGLSTNLAPFSYTQLMNHDPPIFVIGFVSSLAKAKDSLKNLLQTRECVINVISEHFVEAANATSINAPYGVSEWAVSGLTPAPSTTVKPSRVAESVFAVEGRLLNTQEFDSHENPGEKSGTMAVIEGTRIWVRNDAVNDERSLVDPSILKPVSRLGGIMYGRTTIGYEMMRPGWGAATVASLKERGLVEMEETSGRE